MNVKKNVCDSVIDTLLNIQGKTEHDLNTHQDLAEMGIYDQLHSRTNGKKIYSYIQCLMIRKHTCL